jgi:hypothetical protein
VRRNYEHRIRPSPGSVIYFLDCTESALLPCANNESKFAGYSRAANLNDL